MKFSDRLILLVTVLLFGIAQYSTYANQYRQSEESFTANATYFNSLENEIDFNRKKASELKSALDKGEVLTPFYYVDRVYIAGIQSGRINVVEPAKVRSIDKYYLKLEELLQVAKSTAQGPNAEINQQILQKQAAVNALEIELINLEELINVSNVKIDTDHEEARGSLRDANTMLNVILLSGAIIISIVLLEVIPKSFPSIKSASVVALSTLRSTAEKKKRK